MSNLVTLIEQIVDDTILTKYKSEESQRKARNFKDHLMPEIKKRLAELPVVAPVTGIKGQNLDHEPRFLTLTDTEIKAALSRKAEIVDGNGEMKRLDKINEYHDLLRLVVSKEGKELFDYLFADWHRQEIILRAMRWHDFKMEKMEADDGFGWEMKVKIEEEIKVIHSRYKMHLFLNPETHYKRLSELHEQKDEIAKNPQLTLLDDDRKAQLSDIDERIRAELIRFAELRGLCADISFEAKKRKDEYRIDKVENEFGERDLKDCTIIVFRIPAHIVNLINDRREHMKEYALRLEPIS